MKTFGFLVTLVFARLASLSMASPLETKTTQDEDVSVEAAAAEDADRVLRPERRVPVCEKTTDRGEDGYPAYRLINVKEEYLARYYFRGALPPGSLVPGWWHQFRVSDTDCSLQVICEVDEFFVDLKLSCGGDSCAAYPGWGTRVSGPCGECWCDNWSPGLDSCNICFDATE